MSCIPSFDPIVITGIGLISPRAMGIQELVEIAQSPIKRDAGDDVWPLTRFDPRQFLGKQGFKYLTPATRYVLSAARLALEDARLERDIYTPEEKGVILGTNFAIHDIIDAMDRTVLSEGAEALRPMETPNFSINLPASYLSIKHQFRAFNITLTSMLVAGIEAVILASQSIQKGRARMVLAGATEGTPPRRLAQLLGGKVAEGAACVLSLETLSAAQARNAHVYARVGKAALWFAPPGIVECQDRFQLETVFRHHLDRMLPKLQDSITLCLIDTDCCFCQMVNEFVQKYLKEHNILIKHRLCLGWAFAEACVSPVLYLAAAAAMYGEGLVVIPSPLGHITMLCLDPVELKASV